MLRILDVGFQNRIGLLSVPQVGSYSCKFTRLREHGIVIGVIERT